MVTAKKTPGTAAISRVADYRLFLPGPVPVADEVLAAMARPVQPHRDARARGEHVRLRELLRELFVTRQRVFALTSPASGVMELLSRQSVRPGRRIVHLANGAFAERWRDISEATGAKTSRIFSDWGKPLSLAALERELAAGSVDAVAVVYSETSTGMLNPLKDIAAKVRAHPGTLLLVDAVSALAAAPLPVAEWGIDGVFAGVQKALACPPGCTVLSVSDRLLERAAQCPGRGWLWDLVRLAEADDRDSPLATPSQAHLNALALRLEHLLNSEGLAASQRRHEALAAQARDWAQRRLDLFVESPLASPALTTVMTAPGIDPQRFATTLLERTGYVVGGGYGQLASSTFRIGHMGECRPEDLEALLKAMDGTIPLSRKT